MLDPKYYYTVFLHIVLLLSFIHYKTLYNEAANSLLCEKKPVGGMLVFCIFFIFTIGLRPISIYFGDTVNYAHYFSAYRDGILSYNPDSSDWCFNWIMAKIAKFGDIHDFFLLIESLYIIPMFLACRRLVPNRTAVAMLFCLGAFSFFTYGVNGIRNGMACSLVLWAYSYMLGNVKEKVIAGLLCFCAYNVHHSTALPIVCMVTAYFYSNTRNVLIFWILSILVSLVAGSSLETFFASLGFDDRLSTYISDTSHDSVFSQIGFRWDFLLYSFMPILLGWYVVIKKGIADSRYLFLLNTYILCNSFWVMLIRASYSNRFAYLSWFMYPLVLAYPLLCVPVWEDQGKKTGKILVAHTMFTYIMWLLDK